MAHGLAGIVEHQILLRDISDVLAFGVLGIEMVEGLILARANLFGNRAPPFFGIGEGRIDIVNNATKRVNPVANNLANVELCVAGFHSRRELFEFDAITARPWGCQRRLSGPRGASAAAAVNCRATW